MAELKKTAAGIAFVYLWLVYPGLVGSTVPSKQDGSLV